MSNLNKIVIEVTDPSSVVVRRSGLLIGDSAYQTAVKNSYEGTEEQWLLTLKGAKGDKGDDAVLPDNIVIDSDYVHTDNNFDDTSAQRVANSLTEVTTTDIVNESVIESKLSIALQAKVNSGSVAGVFSVAMPLTPVADKVYDFNGVNETVIDAITWYNGDSAWYDGATWHRIPFQSLSNYQKIITNSTNELIGVTVAEIQYIHQRGNGESSGDLLYQAGFFSSLFPVLLQNDIVFDKVKVWAWGNPNSNSIITECRIYESDTFNISACNPANLTLLATKSYNGDFNKIVNSYQIIDFGINIKSTKDKYLILVIFTSNAVQYADTLSHNVWIGIDSNPERLNVLIGNDLNSNYVNTTRYITPFQCINSKYNYPEENRTLINNLELSKSNNYLNDILLPIKINAVIGHELNIWHDSIKFGDIKEIEYISVEGKDDERCFRINPTIAGINPITLNIRNNNRNLVSTKSININVVTDSNGVGTKRILCIGDSLTANGPIVSELNTLITTAGGITPIFIGTKGTSPSKHEGIAGFRTHEFVNFNSPFWDIDKNDFKKYMSINGGGDDLDFVFIQLGINDALNLWEGNILTSYQLNTTMNNYKSLIDSILNTIFGYPNCKIILALPPISGNTKGGFAANYEVLGYSPTKYIYEKNIRMIWEMILLNFDNNVSYPNVYVSANGLMIDRYYGYDLVDSAVSSRNLTQIKIHTNAVHPNDSGYKQLADAYYCQLQYLLSLN